MNKRGMSAVITTLIIILLMIVALGIVWVVVRNVLQGSQEQVEIEEECRQVDLEIKALTVEDADGDGAWDDYSITLSRAGTGKNATRVKIVLSNNAQNSTVIDFGYTLTPLSTLTNSTIDNVGVTNATHIGITPYFLSSTGNEEFCTNTITKEI